MKSLVQFSIKNPLIINVLFLFIIVAGVSTIFKMQREAFPRFSFDTVMVTTTYPGTTPKEIEKLITIPIEKELKEVDDIKEISSVSAEGISVITLLIEEDADNKDKTINDIQRAVDRAEDLPTDLKDKPVVRDLKTQNRPIIEVSLSGNLSEDQLRDYSKSLEKKILDIHDISRIEHKGFRDREIWVEVNPDTMQRKHINISEIGDALKKQNRTIPGGKYYVENSEFILRTTGEFKDHNDVKETIIRASSLGNWVLLKDVAKITPAFEEENTIFKSQGTRSINLVVIKKARGDTINLVREIRTLANEFKKTADPKLKISYTDDTSYFIQRRQNILANNGMMGMVMVIISLFTFLSIRTAIAACIGIPTALFLSFILMNAYGISFNLLSMFGLIMVLGMLVDEDIVISENIYRHLELDRTTEEATLHGVTEVYKPLIATVLTTVAAFIPLMLMGGTMGKFIRHIPIVVTITLFASLFTALVILPSHICDLNKSKLFGKRTKIKKTDKFFFRLVKKYKIVISHCIKYRYLYSLGLFTLFAVIIYFSATQMKFILFPSKGIEIFIIKIEGPNGDSLQTTSTKINEIEKIVATLTPKEMLNFTTRVGIISQGPNDPQLKRASNVGQIKVYLTPEGDRDRDTQQIISDLREKTKHLTEFEQLDFEMRRIGPPVGKPIQIRIRGDDFTLLKKIAEKFHDALKKIKGVEDVKDDYDLDKDEIQIVVDPIKAAQTGLTVEKIAKEVRNAFDGLVATTIKSSEEEIDVVVKFPIELRYDPEALNNLLIPNENGSLIKISHVASFNQSKGVFVLKHHDGIRSINVTANIDEEITSSLGVSNKLESLIQQIEKENPDVNIYFGGEVEETQESLSRLFNAFYLAGALILFILITMFRSILQALVIMLTIPFSIIGVATAFYLHNEPFSFMALMGVIGLTGVVVDTAVIMIDFVNKLRDRGVDPREAIVEGASIRLRAVILTSLTTFVGIIPAAYGIGGLDPFIRPMALALNYGILFGAFITIFYVPVFLGIVEDIRDLGHKLLAKL